VSKKRFTSGLESVFSEDAQFEPNIDESPWLVETAAGNTTTTGPARKKRPTRRTGKSFVSDLDSLFSSNTVQRPREVVPTSDDQSGQQRERPRRAVGALSGLDNLIRDTTNGRAQKQQATRAAQDASQRKRVTFTYDRDRFARLKTIARTEGEYLKDIISGLLNEYISHYESDKGLPSSV